MSPSCFFYIKRLHFKSITKWYGSRIIVVCFRVVIFILLTMVFRQDYLLVTNHWWFTFVGTVMLLVIKCQMTFFRCFWRIRRCIWWSIWWNIRWLMLMFFKARNFRGMRLAWFRVWDLKYAKLKKYFFSSTVKSRMLNLERIDIY